MKPFSEASERNREPILLVLQRIFADRERVLEIGSGTGQHAVHFGAALPHLTWQPSDLPERLGGIAAWLEEACLPNVLPPLALDVRSEHWGAGQFDALFSANVVHIIDWPAVEAMFRGIGRHRAPHCVVALYGPFNYHGHFTSASNAAFDAWLRTQDAASGIRDVEAIDALAADQGLRRVEDNPMPANNRLLVWHDGLPASL
jgi:SAM-dependent methyltransferase